jgi:hypothetical protein
MAPARRASNPHVATAQTEAEGPSAFGFVVPGSVCSPLGIHSPQQPIAMDLACFLTVAEQNLAPGHLRDAASLVPLPSLPRCASVDVKLSFVSVAALSFASCALAEVIFDQIGAPTNLPTSGPEGFYRYGSQIFPGEPQFELLALDDFSMSSAFRIESVSAVIAGYGSFGSFAGIQGCELRIYRSPQQAALGAGAALAVASLGVPASYGAFGTGVRVDLSLPQAIELAAGSYWMSLQAVNPGSNGQIGVVISDIGDGVSWQANPGGGFGVPGNALQRPVNMAYTLEGTMVPVPGGALTIAAAIACRVTRRRYR